MRAVQDDGRHADHRKTSVLPSGGTPMPHVRIRAANECIGGAGGANVPAASLELGQHYVRHRIARDLVSYRGIVDFQAKGAAIPHVQEIRLDGALIGSDRRLPTARGHSAPPRKETAIIAPI